LTEQQWGRESTSTSSNCNELLDLLKIAIRITNGIHLGWRTLTHERDNLQGQPAEALKDAWPTLLEPDTENALPEYIADSSDDKLEIFFLEQTSFINGNKKPFVPENPPLFILTRVP
jgi:hypothetical protein